jgi:hypothetical protein
MNGKAKEESLGRAKTILLAPGAGDAVVATIVVQRRDGGGAERVRFGCSTATDASYEKHVVEEILPVVDSISRALGIPSANFDVTFPALNAPLGRGLAMNVSGRSCDTALFLALLSMAVGIPVDEGIATTGQFVSKTGEIGLVEGIPAKAAAAAADPSVDLFTYPSLTRDRSLETLAPLERDRIEGALAQAEADTCTRGVNDVCELVEHAFKDEAIVLASLERNFFQARVMDTVLDAVLRHTVDHLALENEARLWSAVEEQLGAGDNESLHRLLREFSEYCIRHKAYPRNVGRTLSNMLSSSPPATRRLKLGFPLIPVDAVVRLSQFAGEADFADLHLLYEANGGKACEGKRKPETPSKRIEPTDSPAATAVDTILDELSEATIAQKIGIPLDEARMSFVPVPVQVESWDEFLEITTALYCRFLRYTDIPGERFESGDAEGRVMVLLENAFSREEGIDEAYAEATQPSRKGGMRYVLDAMTERYKAEETEKHILLTMKTGIDPLDHKAKVEFVTAFLERFAPFLPEDIRSKEPGYFANAWELLARAYARSLDAVKSLLRRL